MSLKRKIMDDDEPSLFTEITGLKENPKQREERETLSSLIRKSVLKNQRSITIYHRLTYNIIGWCVKQGFDIKEEKNQNGRLCKTTISWPQNKNRYFNCISTGCNEHRVLDEHMKTDDLEYCCACMQYMMCKIHDSIDYQWCKTFCPCCYYIICCTPTPLVYENNLRDCKRTRYFRYGILLFLWIRKNDPNHLISKLNVDLIKLVHFYGYNTK